MTIQSFEQELQTIHKEFSVKKNQKVENLATVFFYGEPQFAIPSHGIYDYVKEDYGIDLPSGSFIRHRTRPEALAQARNLAEHVKDADYMDALLGRGEYSDEKLK